MRKGWIGVDLDGTLAEYHGWKSDGGIGAPVPAMVARVKRWLSQGWEVRVMTARVAATGRISPESHQTDDQSFALRQKELIWAWCQEHIGEMLPVTHEKDFQMVELWDDRCVQVIANTGEPVGVSTRGLS